MALMKEFREFAIKGNMVDLAIGVVIGAAFGRIIDSLVNDILMPPLAVLTGGVDFVNKFVTLKGPVVATLEEAKKVGAITLNYGAFLNTLVSFLLIALAVFIVIRKINSLRPAVVVPVTTFACPDCLSDIPLGAKRCRFCSAAVVAR